MTPARFLPLAAILAAVPVHAQDAPPEPPRGHPPGFFSVEPRFEPGPFVIFFDADEAQVSKGADEILDNAFVHWPEAQKPRFVLCYDPAEEGEAGKALEDERRATVAAELEKRGAVQVLNSVWDCYHRDTPLRDSRARMAMLGVLDMPESGDRTD